MIIIDGLMCKELSNANRNVELSAINRGVRDVAGKAQINKRDKLRHHGNGLYRDKASEKLG